MSERFEVVRHGYGWAVRDVKAGTLATGEVSNQSIAAKRADALNLDARRKHRPCMCCRASFLSDGPHNRLCGACRAGRDPLAWMSGLVE